MVHIALVSGWQTVNIGDVAHTPGALRAFEQFAPDARLTLWAVDIDEPVRQMIRRYFPHIEIIEDRLESGARPSAALERLFDEADILVHGSAPGLNAHRQLAEWHRRTGKPYGFFGVTVDPLRPYHGTLEREATMIAAIAGDMLDPFRREVLDGASFVYCRDSLSAQFLRGQQIAAPIVEFGPDATVMFDVVDSLDGSAVMAEYGLRNGEFMCAVPRLRFTPYHEIRNYAPDTDALRKQAYNAGYVESDIDALRQGITAWVRATGQQVLIVPEMSYAMGLAETALAGTFPADVAHRISILPRFWDLTEAAAVYRRASVVLSMECHSPLLALAEGIPSIYLRQPTDTIKGQMHHDLGLPLIELGPEAGAEASRRLVAIAGDRETARQHTRRARQAARDMTGHMVAQTVTAANPLESVSSSG